MATEGDVWVSVLPKPRKTLKKMEYYLEVTDERMGTSRTEERDAVVVSGPSACQGSIVAAWASSATVALLAPAGAPLVPAGFVSTGMVPASAVGGSTATAGAGAGTSGGGISGTTIGIAGGVVAAGAVVAVSTGSSGASGPAACSGSMASPTTYSMSGNRQSRFAQLEVDDTLRVFLEGELIHEVGQQFESEFWRFWPSFSFTGSSNQSLAVELSNVRGPFGLGRELVVWRSDGCFKLLLRGSDVPSCCPPSYPCGGAWSATALACASGIYLRRTFTLP